MSRLRRLAAVMVLAGALAEAGAANRCALPGGRIFYTDESCESVGGKPDRPMKNEISVVPLPPSAPVPAAREPGKAAAPASAASFRKAANAPVLAVCYDDQDARKEVTREEVEAAIRGAVALWNAGCNVSFDFLGSCAAETGRHDRPIDYRVWWASWDDTARSGGKTFREHAIAAASPRIGVALNRDVDSEAFRRQWRRSLTHEFGHVIGIGHSGNRRDIMFSGGGQPSPTASDLAACNRVVEQRWGVRSP